MSDDPVANPYETGLNPADTTDPRPLSSKATWFAVSSWIIFLIQLLGFFVAMVIAQLGSRQVGAQVALFTLPILGTLSVLTTLVAVVLIAKCWLRGERNKQLYLATVLGLLHAGLLACVGVVIIAVEMSSMA